MSVYKYVAQSDPNGAVSIINSFGYDVTNGNDLGQCLKDLVNEVGEPALKKIMDFHPDKDIIIEYFTPATISKEKDGCKGCTNYSNGKGRNMLDHYLNASGAIQSTSKDNHSTTIMANQTNAMVFIGCMIVALVLISNKK